MASRSRCRAGRWGSPARVRAAAAAERVFGFADAAGHWLRAIELCQAVPDAADTAGIGVPQLYVRAIDALENSGESVHAGRVAEEAYSRYGSDPDPATTAVVCQRAAQFRALDSPAAGLPLIKQALGLLAQAPPSAEHAKIWLAYADAFLRSAQGRTEDRGLALHRALEIAEAAGAATVIPRVLGSLADDALRHGRVEEGWLSCSGGRRSPRRPGTAGRSYIWRSLTATCSLSWPSSTKPPRRGTRGLEVAGQVGLAGSLGASILAANAAEALVALGRTGEAGALVDPLTPGPPDRDHWVLHDMRAEIDLLRGDTEAAGQRQQLLSVITAHIGFEDTAWETAQRAAELALWAARAGDALAEVQQVLPLFQAPDPAIMCGRLLAAGMWACADLAEQARARRDEPAAEDAVSAADGLVSWVGQMGGAPFTDHPFVATIPAWRATWEAERARLAGASDPAVWGGAAKAWQDLGCPHRAGYSWWRQAQARLDAGQPATAAAAMLRAAATAAEGHVPLMAQVQALSERARIPLHERPAAPGPGPAGEPAPYGLTGRELAVLRLLAAGRTNAQIGTELYMSPKTASVHVTSIFRKLGVSGRVQAAALAERAGLLETTGPKDSQPGI